MNSDGQKLKIIAWKLWVWQMVKILTDRRFLYFISAIVNRTKIYARPAVTSPNTTVYTLNNKLQATFRSSHKYSSLDENNNKYIKPHRERLQIDLTNQQIVENMTIHLKLRSDVLRGQYLQQSEESGEALATKTF
jgi:hypothetical protein